MLTPTTASPLQPARLQPQIGTPWRPPTPAAIRPEAVDGVELSAAPVPAPPPPSVKVPLAVGLAVGAMVAISLIPAPTAVAVPPPPPSISSIAGGAQSSLAHAGEAAGSGVQASPKAESGTPFAALPGSGATPSPALAGSGAKPSPALAGSGAKPATLAQGGGPASSSAVGSQAAPAVEKVLADNPTPQPPKVYTNVAAVPTVDSSVPLDPATSWKAENPPQWRTFNHRAVDNKWFDESGRWTDTQTAVTSDQAAAMSTTQRAALAWAAKVPVSDLRLGDAGLIEVEAAVGTIDNADALDAGRALIEAHPRRPQTLNFGHRAIHGHLFAGRTWADSKTLVSADQVAAMPSFERKVLAHSAEVPVESLKVGNAARASIDEATLLKEHRFEELAAQFPNRFVTAHGFRMRADTAARFQKLLHLVGKRFPGRGVRVTSTVGGRHIDPAHHQGRAIDFVVEPLKRKESFILENLAREAGFSPFNEYVHSSPYKTGPHMHISAD